MTESVHCPHCGAPYRERAARFCPYCGTKVPEAPKVVVGGWAPNSPERFEAVANHPTTEGLMQHVPASGAQAMRIWFYVGICALFAVIGILITLAGLADRGASGPPVALGLLIVLLGAFLVWLMTRRALDFRKAPIVRAIALVADERVSVSGGKHASTTYYATFELQSGRRHELEVDEELAAKLALHDMGVLYFKDDELLGFQRVRG